MADLGRLEDILLINQSGEAPMSLVKRQGPVWS